MPSYGHNSTLATIYKWSRLLFCVKVYYIGDNVHDIIAMYVVSARVFLFGVLNGAFYKVLVHVTGWLTAAELELDILMSLVHTSHLPDACNSSI